MVARIYRPSNFPGGGGDVTVAMTTLSASSAFAQFYDQTGTVQPLHSASVQIANGIVNTARPVDGVGSGAVGDQDVFQFAASNDVVVWDDRTTDAVAQPQLFGANRYGLPGLSGGDSGTMNQTRAIDVFDMGAGDDLVSLIYNSVSSGIEYTANATIYGGDGNDVVWSGAGNDFLYGGNNSDRLFGGDGVETIFGGAGVDTVQGGAGGDTLVGGVSVGAASEGDWVSYSGSSLGVNLTLTFDIAVVQGGGDAIGDHISGFDNAIGSFGNDEINLSAGDTSSNSLVGLGGNDTMRGGGGNDFFYGGAGGGVTLANAQAGGIDTIFGNDGDDTIVFDPDGTIDGAGGNDSVLVYVGDGSGAVRPNNLTLDLTGGRNWSRDLMEGNNGFDTIVLTSGDDVLLNNQDDLTVDGVTQATNTGTSLIEYVDGGGGNDVILMNNAAVGTAGANYTSATTILGSGGNDFIAAGLGSDLIYGDSNVADPIGDDTVFGGGGADTVYGGSGDDLIEGGSVGDTLYGGGGNDTLSYSFSDTAVTVTLGGANSGGHAQGDVVTSDFENLAGSAFNDVLSGDGNANRIFGNDGLDSLRGFAGNDTIFGGAGIDTVEGGVGSDSLYGGGNGDWLSYANAGGGVAVNLALATQTSASDASGDVIGGFQNLIGSGNNDTLTGDAGINTIYGGGGFDTINGGAGADSLAGGGQGDWVSYAGSAQGVSVDLALATAQSGGDAAGDVLSGFLHLIGSSQDDSLIGTSGNNTIFGGAGHDTIEGGAGGDSLAGGGDGGDWLVYANSNAGVWIDLANHAANGGHATGDAISGFANLLGSAHDDSLTGDIGDNAIVGGLGVDTVEGGGGDDVMYGGADTVAPTDGDWLSYNAAAIGVQASLFAGTATGGAGNDQFTSFQHLVGSNTGNDFLEGDDELNSLVGQGGNDTLSGLTGIDSLFGGEGDDLLLMGTNGGTFENGTVYGWDGENNAQIGVAVPLGAARVSDKAFGGNGTDTLDLSSLSGATNSVLTAPDQTIANHLAGIEIIVAGAAADVINLTFNDGVTRTAYAGNVTIFAGDGNDVVFSGSGNDRIAGGLATGSGAAGFNDTLFGGQGTDLIYGDDFNVDNTTGGDDTLFGGGGLDTVIGGGGNDTISDNDGGLLYGGHGADVVVLIGGDGLDDYLASGGFVEIGGSINPNASTDGNDLVFVGGSYNSMQSDLGAGDDSFIASASTLGSGFQTDVVTGGTGSDAISSWYGDDVLYGDYDPSDTSGNGNGDALWGGAGVDIIYGGPGGDILYGGEGDGDLLIGGDGSDYYYWGRADGIDLINDDDTVAGGEGDNYILVFSGYDGTGQMPAGSGVFETDQDLYDNAGGDDMVQLVDLDGVGAGTIYRLTILQGAGAGSSIEFDQTQISVIGLWNNDAAGSTPVITAYVWDPIDGRYEYSG